MNFRLIIGGRRFIYFDELVKFICYSASHSDYVVSSLGFKRLTPYAPYINEIKLTGSSKKEYVNIVLDMDKVITNFSREAIFLTPDILEITPDEKGTHYWGMMGALFKMVGDISPAYVTGYLLEKNMKKELDIFTSLSSTLPIALQAAAGDFLKGEN